MSNELRTYFTKAERDTIISGLLDEFGDQKFSDELIQLECQDLWRKGCHNLEDTEDCRGCECSRMNGGHCPLEDWEERNPEYKDDALAKRLKGLKAELRGEQRAKIEKSLLAKGYIKVQWSQFNDGEMLKSEVKLYQPGSKDLMAALAEAIENWKNMWAEDFMLQYMNLNAKSGKIMDLRTEYGDEYEIWEIL